MPASMLDYFNMAQFICLCAHKIRYVDRVFYLYPQLSNWSHFEINTVLPKSNYSEVSALFPWNQGSYINLIVQNVVQTSEIFALHNFPLKFLRYFRFSCDILYGWVKLQIKYRLLFVANILDFVSLHNSYFYQHLANCMQSHSLIG